MFTTFRSIIGNATAAVCFTFLFFSLPAIPFTACAETPEVEQHQDSHSPEEGLQRFKIVFEPDAYYTDLDLIISLTRAPIPYLGEMTELEIYRTLLTRAALVP
jgi:hypothetical protein